MKRGWYQGEGTTLRRVEIRSTRQSVTSYMDRGSEENSNPMKGIGDIWGTIVESSDYANMTEVRGRCSSQGPKVLRNLF